jgi:hypothetical protein
MLARQQNSLHLGMIDAHAMGDVIAFVPSYLFYSYS